MLQIKSWKSWKNDKVLFEYEGLLKEAVEEAVRQGISLECADLRYANLEGANLRGADLRYANLYRANLKYADLKNANLFANLMGANLEGANLNGANLESADLHEANLNGANFEGTNLYNADLRLAKNIPNDIMPLACPTEGSFVAWKKVKSKLVKLEIPEDAKRSSATTNKCRCSKAKVLAITNLDETETFEIVTNWFYEPLTYKVGEMAYPDWFNEDRWDECSHGIHFFMDKREAINWQ